MAFLMRSLELRSGCVKVAFTVNGSPVELAVDPRATLLDTLRDTLGLTGTKEEIDKVVGLYGAAYEITPTPDSAEKYSVSHTTSLYAVDPEGRTRIEFRYEATVDEIVQGLRAILAVG